MVHSSNVNLRTEEFGRIASNSKKKKKKKSVYTIVVFCPSSVNLFFIKYVNAIIFKFNVSLLCCVLLGLRLPAETFSILDKRECT